MPGRGTVVPGCGTVVPGTAVATAAPGKPIAGTRSIERSAARVVNLVGVDGLEMRGASGWATVRRVCPGSVGRQSGSGLTMKSAGPGPYRYGNHWVPPTLYGWPKDG